MLQVCYQIDEKRIKDPAVNRKTQSPAFSLFFHVQRARLRGIGGVIASPGPMRDPTRITTHPVASESERESTLGICC